MTTADYIGRGVRSPLTIDHRGNVATTAGTENIEITRREVRTFLTVACKEREHEQFAKRICVYVARHMQEVRNVAPPNCVII